MLKFYSTGFGLDPKFIPLERSEEREVPSSALLQTRFLAGFLWRKGTSLKNTPARLQRLTPNFTQLSFATIPLFLIWLLLINDFSKVTRMKGVFKSKESNARMFLSALMFLIAICFFPTNFYSQEPFQHPDEREMPLKFKHCGTPGTYLSIGNWHKAFLVLNNDSTFALHNITDVAFDLTLGTYHVQKSNILFQWDSVKTHAAVQDPSIYQKFFAIRKPNPLKINKTVFTVSHNKKWIERNVYARMEIFFSSKQLFTHGLIIDSLKGFIMPYYKTAPKNQFVLVKQNGIKVIFPLDSVFAHRWLTSDGTSGAIYRGSMKIQQYAEGLTIYSLFIEGSNGGHHVYYFSKTLDGKLYKLDKEHLMESYGDNPDFIEEIKNSKSTLSHLNGGLTAKDEKGEFHVITLYKKSLKDKTDKQ